MARGESVTTYLTRVSQVWDELAAVEETVDSAELIRVALNGFSKSWETFVRGIVARENMPSWERLWDAFVQEELRVGSSSSSGQRGGDEDTVALAAKGKKKIVNWKGPKEGDKRKEGGEQQQHDMSKVKCLLVTSLDTMLYSAQTGRRSRWLLLQMWRILHPRLRGSSLS